MVPHRRRFRGIRYGNHRYGDHHSQVAELWRPVDRDDATPVVVLIHGGYWRAMYTKRLMHRLAAAIVGEGWTVWNIEYRRTGPGGGGGGWPATFVDVAAATDHLATIDGLDLGRVVTCGHSAGGHLALWLAARARLPDGAPGTHPAVAVTHAVSLAGVVDLERAAQLGLGGGAVQALLGGDPGGREDRYRGASPAALLPLGLPQTLIHGDRDGVVPLSLAEGYRDRALQVGDPVTLQVVRGADHMDMIAPRGSTWEVLRATLRVAGAGGRAGGRPGGDGPRVPIR